MLVLMRILVIFIVSSIVFTPSAVFTEELKSKFYIVSLKDTYANKKYKVRAFFLDHDSNIDIYSIPKMPDGWHYHFNDDRSTEFIAAAYTDKESVDIGFFKDFISFILRSWSNEQDHELYFSMTLIYYKPDGTPEIKILQTQDFIIKEIHKGLKAY
ncbi:MAG: hypothetical protein H7843_04790 [Nitrospirota bacterium]